MAWGDLAMPGTDFSGLNTRVVVEYLRDQMPRGTLAAVLEAAGETRSVEVLLDDTSWSSYQQLRRLLEATGAAMGGPQSLALVGRDASFISDSAPDVIEAVRALGSPDALYAATAEGGDSGLVRIGTSGGWETAPREWLLTQRFFDGYDAFPEFCSFLTGLLSTPPRLFGYPPAEVIEEQCQAEGATECRFRVRWDDRDDPVRRTEHASQLAQGLARQLEALQQTVADIVSAESIDSVLTRLVSTVARTVVAPAHVLALSETAASDRKVYSVGLQEPAADRIANELLAEGAEPTKGQLVVDVASARQDYGKLAVLDSPDRTFYPGNRVALEAYARLAASALDSAAALEAARQDATTAHALLDLSTSLAQIVTVEEVATRLARTVPAVVDCDASAVLLFDIDGSKSRVAAIHGLPRALEASLYSLEFEPGPEARSDVILFHEPTADTAAVANILTAHGGTAALSVPIIGNSGSIGRLIVAVYDHPERLRRDPELPNRMRAVAGQAATAISNARLLDSIRHQALHDALTGLPNRVLILDRVESMLSRARRSRQPVAVLFIDLDGFKSINDTLGHHRGDQLLQAVAERLATALRDSDSIGRLGGDEFVVLVEGDGLEAGPGLVCERLLGALGAPFEIGDGVRIHVTASIGIAVGDRGSAGELLRDADVALYRAKADGKNRYVVFATEMRDAVTDRLKLEMDLHGALDRGEFFLVYQPIFEMDTGRVTGAEALLRWAHPVRGIVQPDSFVPLLEETGAIVDVGRWVLTEACRQAARWHARGHHIDLAVNFSARQLEDPGVLGDIRAALGENDLDPATLMVEITETAIMRDADATAARLRTVRELGVRIAIDDFGTGYSSLGYLSQFPVDLLKIDRSFVAAIAESPEGGALTHMLVELGKTLGLETLAEGIEHETQYAQLLAERCDSGQGFLVAEPLAGDELGRFLDQRTAQLNVGAVG
jgi:diguanylate cyclase (GGDEF)-like protein